MAIYLLTFSIPQSLDIFEASNLVYDAGFLNDPLIGLSMPGRLSIEVMGDPSSAKKRLLATLPTGSALINESYSEY